MLLKRAGLRIFTHTEMLRNYLRFVSFGTSLQRQSNVIMFEKGGQWQRVIRVQHKLHLITAINLQHNLSFNKNRRIGTQCWQKAWGKIRFSCGYQLGRTANVCHCYIYILLLNLFKTAKSVCWFRVFFQFCLFWFFLKGQSVTVSEVLFIWLWCPGLL